MPAKAKVTKEMIIDAAFTAFPQENGITEFYIAGADARL